MEELAREEGGRRKGGGREEGGRREGGWEGGRRKGTLGVRREAAALCSHPLKQEWASPLAFGGQGRWCGWDFTTRQGPGEDLGDPA